MLQSFRKAGQSLVGKIIATVLFGLLIFSFAIWGIGDIFRGAPRNSVARVGSTEISVEQFRTAYNNEIQRLSRQFRTNLGPEQARALGIDQRVLGQLVNEALLNERAQALGLSVSDQLVARSVLEEPAFRGADGQFNRPAFEEALRSAGLSEAGFVQEQRALMMRQHIASAVAGEPTVPGAAIDALHRYLNERRSASYFVLGPAAAGEIPAPSDADLQAFFEERKASYRAPEYRSASILELDASKIAKPESVSDADARQRYEQSRDAFGTPERRAVQQIVFPNPEEAKAAAERLTQGLTFEALAAERNISPEELTLGTFTRAEMLDPAVAEAAFSLQEGQTSGPVEGRFGTVLVHVTKIEPESVRPFEEVVGEVKSTIANERARAEIESIHDKIEDMRAGARPLNEIAAETHLSVQEIPAIDQNDTDKQGNKVELPQRDALVRAIFESDIGVDNEAIRTSTGGYVWFDVTNIEPARDRTLDEVKDEVTRQWRENTIADRLAERARQFVERLGKGESLETLAADAGVSTKMVTELTRRSPKDDLSADVVARIFATPVRQAAHAATGPDTRAVFVVTEAMVPPLMRTTQEAQRLEDQLRAALSDDLMAQFLAATQRDVPVTIHQAAVSQVVGGSL
jgi:peptidyl-prolyl cis-trans isomerase D